MNKITKFLIICSIVAILVVPALSFAAGLVGCDGTSANPCGFIQIITLINKVIEFIFKDLVIPIAAVMFAYAGFLLVTAGGETAGARTKAKAIFTNTLLGLVISAAAYLIIKTILSILGFNGPMYL